jgi:hypothetical protein
MKSFRHVALATSIIAFVLALVWAFTPQLLLGMWATPDPDSVLAHIMGARMAALFLAFAVIFFRVKDQPPSETRNAVVIGFSIGCLGLAISGVLTFLNGQAGILIFSAIIVELILAIWMLLSRDS